MTLGPKEQPQSVSSPSLQTPEPVRLLIADDHHLFNEGIKQMLSTEPWLLVVGQVFAGSDVMPAVQATSPHLLLLDVNFPGIDGFDIAADVKKKMPSLKLVFLTMYSDALMVQKAKDLGANGYLLKTATQQELLHCIRTVMCGETSFFTLAKAGKEPSDAYAAKYKLTSREIEIIRLVCRGLSSQQIADTVFLSVYTVETHRRNINLKLGVKNPAELIRKAQEIGL